MPPEENQATVVTCAENKVSKIKWSKPSMGNTDICIPVVPQICIQTDTQTNTHHNSYTLLPYDEQNKYEQEWI